MARKQLGAFPSNALDSITKSYADISPTAVKTGAYSANANEFVPADATSAGFTVTLPTFPSAPDRARVIVKKMDSSANLVTIAVSGTDHINSATGSTSMTLSLQNQTVSFQYSFASGIWYIFSSDVPLSGLDTRYITPTSSSVLTNKTLTSPVLTSPRIGSDIYDVNGVTVLGLGATPSAVNWLYIVNNVAGGVAAAAPYIGAAGGDPNIDIGFGPRGTGGIYYFQPTGNTAKYSVDGTASNIDLNFIPKGTGKVQANGIEVATISGTQTLTGKTIVNGTSGNSITGIGISALSAGGTASGTTYLRGDNQWATVSAPALRTTSTSGPGATPTWNTNSFDLWQFTAVATPITSMTTNFTSTSPTLGQKMMVSFKDNGTPQTISWGTSFQPSGVAALLSTTVANKTHWATFLYDGTKWTCMASDPNGY